MEAAPIAAALQVPPVALAAVAPDTVPPAPPLGVMHLAGVAHTVHTLGDILAVLHISIADSARTLRMPRSSAYRLITAGEWPARMSDEMVLATARALTNLLVRRGANRLEMTRIVTRSLPPFLQLTDEADDDQVDASDGQATPTTPTTLTPEEPPMLMAKQTLSPSARKAFTLFTNPFDGEVIDDAQMFTNGEIAYVREACMQAAVGGRFVAVVSESGGGKTTMLGDLESRLQRDHKPVLVIKPWVLGMEDNDTKGKTLKSTDILASIVTTLDPLATVPQTLQARSNKAKDLLTKSTEAGYSHLLVIEEAHSLPEATLKHLKRLHEMRMGRKPLLGILLLGQTELAMKLDPRRANLREVTQRCEVVQLMPLDGDLQAYLAHRATAAGRELGEFIDKSGVDELRARLTITRPTGAGKTSATSLLYPLAVNNLMTAALNVAADLGVPVVTRDVVRGV